MARRRRRTNVVRRTADPYRIASSMLVRRVVVKSVVPNRVLAYSDRRLYHPLVAGVRPAGSVRRADRRLVPTPLPYRDAGVLSFAVPRNVSLCVRRKERREVLFAKGLSRRGAGSAKRRNEWSKVRC